MTASLSDILTATKNNVVATNAIAATLAKLYNLSVNAQLYQGQLPTSVGVLYTAGSAAASLLSCINACNTTGGALGLYLFIVPSGGTAGASNAVMYNSSINANTTTLWEGRLVIPAGATLQGYSSGAGITLNVSGVAL